MTIIFNGNDYKYELESVVKLFYPATLFTLLYDARTAMGDFCFTRKRVGKKRTYNYVYAKIGDNTTHLCSTVCNNTDDIDKVCELILCRLLFICLERLTGISPQWGLITGIRPVKRVNHLLNQGMNEDSIKKYLKSEYLVSDEKINLALTIAKTQEDILNNLNENTFSLYISVPFCPTRCSYCSFVSTSVDKVFKIIPQYITNLCEEIRCTAKIAKELGFTLDTVYFGGGTPTAITARQLEQLMQTVNSSFDLSSLKEYTVEAGRADTITPDKLSVIKDNGATRISINPQTLNDDVLKIIGRRHTVKEVIDSFNLARKMGFDNINMDLIAGLPGDTLTSFQNTIDRIIALNPENVTVHTLSIKRAAKLNDGSREVLANPAPQMVDYASKNLVDNGYNPYYLYRQKNTLGNLENTGFAKNGKESLYNIYIMEEVQNIFAVGAGASTKIVRGNNIERIFNYKHPLEYNNHFDLMLEKKEMIKNYFK